MAREEACPRRGGLARANILDKGGACNLIALVTVDELIAELQELPPETRKLRVCVQDGLDPSDSDEAEYIVVAPHFIDRKDCVHIK